MNLKEHLYQQRIWSLKTFGPGYSTQRVLDHMKKEIAEVESASASEQLGEWVDLILLALDGAWRSGAGVSEICEAIEHKQQINESRQWPDWREADKDKAIEHVRHGADICRHIFEAVPRTGKPHTNHIGRCKFCGFIPGYGSES